MQQDTRKLLRTGLAIFGVGAFSALSVRLFFGGFERNGPQTNAGWLALVIALGCLPTGTLTLALAALKLFGGDRHR